MRSSLILFLFSVLFFACSDDNGGAAAPMPATSTEVIFYTNQNLGCGTITINLDSQGDRMINSYYDPGGQPQCDTEAEAVYSNVPFGNYTFTGLSPVGCTWEGTVNVNDADDCVRLSIDDSYTGRLCDRWVMDLSCITMVQIDSVESPCGSNTLGAPPPMVPRLTIKNECDQAQKVVLCSGSQVLETITNGAGLAPGGEDTFVTCGLAIESYELFAILQEYSDQYECAATIALCN